MFQLDFKKAEEPEIKLPTSVGSSKKQESSRKTSTSALLTMPKPLTVWITINCKKFLKRWEYQTTWHATWEICTQVKKQQLEPDMEQQIGCIWEWDEKRWARRSISWNQDFQAKYQSPQICRWHHPYGRKWRRTQEPLDESERGEWKVDLKLNIQKTKIMASGPITSWQIDGETVETVADFRAAPKSLQMVTAAMKLKDAYSLEGKLWPT